MSRRTTRLTVLTCLLAACASGGTLADRPVLSQSAPSSLVAEPAAAAEPAREGVGSPAAAVAVEQAPPAAVRSAPRRDGPGGTQGPDLNIWRSERFRQFFTDSYLAETEVEPPITEGNRKLIQDVAELMSEERKDEALEVILEENPDGAVPTLDFFAANIYYEQDRIEDAIPHLEKATEQYPRFQRAWQQLGVFHFRLGNNAEAIRPLTRAIALGAGDGLLMGMLGFAYFNTGNSLSAESAFRQAVLLDPDTIEWKMGLAYSLLKQARYGEASALCSALIDEQPDKAELWLLQANAYIGLNQPLKAAENYEMVDRLDGSTFVSLATLGDIYVNENLFDLAVAAHLKSLSLDAEAPLDRALRAAGSLSRWSANDEVKALAQGIEDLRGERLTDTQRKELLRLRAAVALAEGAGDEEAAVLQEIVRLDPLDGQALILLGRHAERGGEVERAAAYFERAADLEDHEVDALIAHGQLLVRNGQPAEALPLLERAQGLEHREHVQSYLEEVQRVVQRR